MSENSFLPTDRTRVKRGHKRASYDKQTVYNILDATPMCHLSYLRGGLPAIIPTLQWRKGDYVYWHGSAASYALEASSEAQVCLSVTLLDGLVMARSAFHHSVNYRSVVLYGEANVIDDPDIKAEKLKDMIDAIYPGRWDLLRPMTAKEVKATSVMFMKIEEVSAKIRTGMPVDDEEDYDLPIWAGVLPVHQNVIEPEHDPKNLDDVMFPEHLKSYELG